MAHTKHLTPKDLAERWSLSVQTLANQRSAGRGPAYLRLSGNRVVYRLQDIETYEQGLTVQPIGARR